jgi:hypothetical protein
MNKYIVVVVAAAFALALALTLGRRENKTTNLNDPAAVTQSSSARSSTGEGTPHPPISRQDSAKIDFSGIETPAGGKTVADLYSEKGSLSGHAVVVRGKVVKFTPNVMGKNWIHVRDGTGVDGTNDLTVTTNSVVKIGDTVVASGVLALDRDFGFGYVYDIIIEDAEVTVE